jgi:hypothetical protein
MNISEFASKYNLRLQYEPSDEAHVIVSRDGQSQIYEYGSELLGVIIMPKTNNAYRWRSARRAFESVGIEIRQSGDTEGSATFDPTDCKQVQVVMKHAKIRQKRTMSAAQLAAFERMRANQGVPCGA